jgi:hypothetical protein
MEQLRANRTKPMPDDRHAEYQNQTAPSGQAKYKNTSSDLSQYGPQYFISPAIA